MNDLRSSKRAGGVRNLYMRTLRWSPLFCAVVLIAIVPSALAQNTPDTSLRVSNPYAKENAEQIAKMSRQV